ncbi:CZB domain-containing protein [Sulfurimonas sp. HSL1-2]|uniref:CZB domain-containing protein n=1 Tax=Thiomicrolovo zhangzhouensis TaxID=3131933 RepID=UPI0031F7639E
MDKAQTLEQLSAAKTAHIKWVNRAKALVGGLPVEKDAIPVDSTDCQFGQWFYGEGQKLHAIPGMDRLSTIETLHFTLHDTYLKIFGLYFGEMNRSFFSKLFNMKPKISDSDKALAKEYFQQLEGVSKQLLDEIGRLERRLNAMSAESFEEK